MSKRDNFGDWLHEHLWYETPAEARDGLAAQEAQDEQDPGDYCWTDEWLDEDRDELAEHIASGGRPPFYRPKEYDS